MRNEQLGDRSEDWHAVVKRIEAEVSQTLSGLLASNIQINELSIQQEEEGIVLLRILATMHSNGKPLSIDDLTQAIIRSSRQANGNITLPPFLIDVLRTTIEENILAHEARQREVDKKSEVRQLRLSIGVSAVIGGIFLIVGWLLSSLISPLSIIHMIFR